MGQKKRALWETQSAHESENELLLAEDGVLRGLGHAELHNLLSRDLDGRASGGVATLTRLAVHENELAQAGQCEAVLGVLVRECRDALERGNRLLLGDSDSVGDRGCDLGLSQCFGHNVYCS